MIACYARYATGPNDVGPVTARGSRQALMLIGELQLLRGLVVPGVAITAHLVELLSQTSPGLPEERFDLRSQLLHLGL